MAKKIKAFMVAQGFYPRNKNGENVERLYLEI